jgi:hypothetical protein
MVASSAGRCHASCSGIGTMRAEEDMKGKCALITGWSAS